MRHLNPFLLRSSCALLITVLVKSFLATGMRAPHKSLALPSCFQRFLEAECGTARAQSAGVWSCCGAVLGSGDSALHFQEKPPTVPRTLAFSLVPLSPSSTTRSFTPFLLIRNVPPAGNELLCLLLPGMVPNQGFPAHLFTFLKIPCVISLLLLHLLAGWIQHHRLPSLQLLNTPHWQ